MCSAVYCGAAGVGALRLLQDVRAGLAAADKANAVFQLKLLQSVSFRLRGD
jgi:hypothetical protein